MRKVQRVWPRSSIKLVCQHTLAISEKQRDNVRQTQRYLLLRAAKWSAPGRTGRVRAPKRGARGRHGSSERENSLTGESASFPRHTAIEPAMPFWQAEEYHQKYLAKMLSMNSMLYGEERKPIPP